MTQNQLQYWRNQETERSNRASEANDYIKALASQLQANVAEQNLSNQYTQAQASMRQAQVAERNLSNLAMQAQASQKQANVAERNLANLARTADANYKQAAAAEQNASTNYRNYLLEQSLRDINAQLKEAQAAQAIANATKTQVETGSGWLNGLGSVLKAIASF